MKADLLKIFILLPSCVSCIRNYYMRAHCGNTFDITDVYQVQIKTDFGDYPPNLSCVVKLKAGSGSRMMVYFKNLDMESDCDNDYFSMYDGSSTSDFHLGPRRKYCGRTTPSGVFTTSGRFLTLKFVSDVSIEGKGFLIVVTEYHTGFCYFGESRCSNGRCIDETLTCNNYNPCGDNSDCPVSVGTVIGAVIGSLCFAGFVLIVIIMLRRRRRRARVLYGTSAMVPSVATTVTSANVTPTAPVYDPPPPYESLQCGYSQPVPTQYTQFSYPKDTSPPPSYTGAQEMRIN